MEALGPFLPFSLLWTDARAVQLLHARTAPTHFSNKEQEACSSGGSNPDGLGARSEQDETKKQASDCACTVLVFRWRDSSTSICLRNIRKVRLGSRIKDSQLAVASGEVVSGVVCVS